MKREVIYTWDTEFPLQWGEHLRAFKRLLMEEAIRTGGGIFSRAAEELGLDPHDFRRIRKNLGLKSAAERRR
jgi:transcriptional regulator with GAF, ATPase, and Fis domain